MGHSEGASGLTSLIKAVLALEKRIIPPNIHFESPNPNIPFDEGKLMVPLEATPWPRGRSERVSVNSFGIGGSNVHVILDSAAEFAPPLQRTGNDTGLEQQPKVLFVSAQSEESLQKRIRQVADYANSKEGGLLKDLAYTLAVCSTQLSNRAFAVANLGSPIDPSSFQTFHAFRDPHVTFVFTGQGAQWVGMGHALMSEYSEFKRDILEMDNIIKSIDQGDRRWSLAGELQNAFEHCP